MREFFRGIWVIAYRDMLRYVQERARLVSSFFMPVLFLVVFGAGFNRMVGDMAPGVDFTKFIYPGIIGMTVLTNSVFSGLSIVWDREFGFLREVLVAPISRSGIVLGKAIGTAIIATLQGLIMLVLAPILDVSITPMLVVKLVPVVIILSISLSSLGLLIGSRMRSQQGFHMVTSILIFPLIWLAGVFFPVNDVPVWMEVLGKANPLTYGVDAIRRLFLDGSVAGSTNVLGVTVFGHTTTLIQDVLIVGALGALLMSIAVYAFSRQE
jgi:ABC-2 type transport system permease protein